MLHRAMLPDPTQPLDSTWRGTIQARVGDVARRTPDRCAVRDAWETWSYRELDAWSSRLAHRLLAGGIQRGDVVAIYGHRSAPLLWAVLGILKAGAAFLVLDPAYPLSRLVGYVRRARPRGWVEIEAAGGVPQPLDECLSDLRCACRITLGSRCRAELDGAWAGCPDQDPGVVLGPNDVSSVTFSSGSSGEPKGIVAQHGSLTHFNPWYEETFGLGPDDRFSQLFGISHNPLQQEIFLPLWLGAVVCIPDPALFGVPGRLAEWMAEEGISFANLTPALGQLIAGTARPDLVLPALRYVLYVGDKLTRSDVALLRRLAPGVTCINTYGSTEAQRSRGCYVIPPHSGQAADPAEGRDPAAGAGQAMYPLGQGLPGVQLLVLNGDGQVAGVGEVGEIYVRSMHLTLGYLDDEALTRERFIVNPFTGHGDDRLYRTGDLGRYLPSGDVESRGRADRQVKLRGFRIEPIEIEAALVAHPSGAVRDAAVVLRDDAPGGRGLVAYVLGDRAALPPRRELRAWLRERLPDYMLPAAVISLGAFPLTPNGKIDYRALPAPAEAARAGLDAPYVAPRTRLEAILAEMWGDVLDVDVVGVEDAFLDLGGDSIKGTILASRLQERLGQMIYVVALYEAMTIARLAACLEANYSDAVGRLVGQGQSPPALPAGEPRRGVGAGQVAEFRRLITPLAPRPEPSGPKNRPAIFILSPQRSGSTLLRVMLAGHPRLFAPPQLELLSFNTLGERRAVFSGPYGFWRQGAIRAVRQLRGWSAEQAQQWMDELEDHDLPVKQFYGLVQEWLGDRVLVDKTPSYAHDLRVLERAEADFDSPLYVHLVRHPAGVVHSFDEAKIEQLFWRKFPFAPQELAELIWLVSHQNIVDFLSRVPVGRQCRVYFEELVRQPQATVEQLCRFLGLEPVPEMLRPYDDPQERMTDGTQPQSSMIGDPSFFKHSTIEAAPAERWRAHLGTAAFLSDITWHMAGALGYEREGSVPAAQEPAEPVMQPVRGEVATPDWSTLIPIQPEGSRPPFFCVHGFGGQVVGYARLARELGPDQPLYGLQARGLDGRAQPDSRVEDMAAHYARAIRSLQPHGPYYLGGYCYGGVVAFEVACQLQAQGETVALLAVMEGYGIKRSEARGQVWRPRHVARFVLNLPFWIRDRLLRIDDHNPVAYRLRRWARALRRQVRRGWMIPDARDKIGRIVGDARLSGMSEEVQRVMDTHVQAMAAYRPPVYPGRVTLFRVRGLPLLRSYDPTLGWGRLAAGGVDIRMVSGAHYNIIKPPHVAVLAARLRESIERALPADERSPQPGEQSGSPASLQGRDGHERRWPDGTVPARSRSPAPTP